jgi:hypothetical protein
MVVALVLKQQVIMTMILEVVAVGVIVTSRPGELNPPLVTNVLVL